MLGSSLAGRGSGHTRFFRFVCILGCIGFVEANSDLYYTLNYPGCPLTGDFVTQCRSCAAQDGYFWSTTSNTCNTCTNVQYRTARTSDMFGSQWEPLLGLYTSVLKCISCPAFYTSGSWTAGRANSCKCSSGTCQSNCNTDSNEYSYCTDTTTDNCPPGRGLVSGTCTNCVAGKYKSTVGVSTCTDCGNTFELGTGPIFSQSRDNCVCEAGYGHKGLNFGSCQLCPTNSYSPKARYDLAVCTCNAGYQTSYYGYDNTINCYNAPTSCPTGQYLSGSSCVQCAAGKYKATTGTEECIACPSTYGYGSTSPADSTSFSACVCTHGAPGTGLFFIMDTTTSKCLRKCEAGKYGTADDCVYCPQNTYNPVADSTSVSACLSCPALRETESSGTQYLSGCMCTAGYYAPNCPVNLPCDNPNCVPCEAGKYSAYITNLPVCSECAVGKFSSSPGSTTCTLCPPGTHKEFPGVNAACDNCGVDSI